MNNHLLLEAALRSLLMGAIIWVVLRAMRIDQVRARRTAWLLALFGALAMPALIAAHIGPRLLPVIMPIRSQEMPVPSEGTTPAGWAASNDAVGARRQPLYRQETRLPPKRFAGTWGSLATLGYCAVAAVLSLRLLAGIGLAMRLRKRSTQAKFPFDPDLDVRVCSRISTPVTIGSTVLVPGTYTAWDDATLRIVLSHERAHVRQRDFYVHALAGLHCALFWFNPFSWWLKRELAELGEALSDGSAVEQAESRVSYAEILLAFATHDRLPDAAIAMARVSNLALRIERLLSDHRFERSFAAKQRLPYLSAGVVILAMAIATSMARVQAAPTDQLKAATPPTNSLAAAGSDTQGVIQAANPATNTNTNTNTSGDPNSHAGTKVTSGARSAKNSARKVDTESIDQDETVDESHADGVMVINAGRSHTMFDSGSRLPSHRGDYVYFQYQGKPYLIQDPVIIAQAQAMLAPMKTLREQQEQLGVKQRELARQQATLGAQQAALVSAQVHAARIDSPEFKRDMADLKKEVKDLHLDELTAEIDRNTLAEVQTHLAQIQAATGKLTADLAMQGAVFDTHQSALGEGQGHLGEEQGKLGEQQARLGEQQSKIAEQVRRQLKPIIEQAIREGKGTAVTEP